MNPQETYLKWKSAVATGETEKAKEYALLLAAWILSGGFIPSAMGPDFGTAKTFFAEWFRENFGEKA